MRRRPNRRNRSSMLGSLALADGRPRSPSPLAATLQSLKTKRGVLARRRRAERCPACGTASTFSPNGALELHPVISAVRTVKRRERRAPPNSQLHCYGLGRGFPESTLRTLKSRTAANSVRSGLFIARISNPEHIFLCSPLSRRSICSAKGEGGEGFEAEAVFSYLRQVLECGCPLPLSSPLWT